MKQLKQLFVGVCCMIATMAHATPVDLHFTHMVDGQALALNSTVYTNEAGINYKITRADFYMSQLKLVHDGDQRLSLPNYLLVRQGQTDFELGNYDGFTNLEGFEFSVGIDPDANHLDPSSYAANNPLANQNPSMHWGWSAGYRFIALEGVAADANGNFTNGFEIHVLFDDNLRRASISTSGSVDANGTLNINATVNYAEMLRNIDLSGTVIAHGSGAAHEQLLVNLAHGTVFSASAATALPMVAAWAGGVQFANPSQVQQPISYQFAASDRPTIAYLYDISGKMVQSYQLSATQGSFYLPQQLGAGSYVLHFADLTRKQTASYRLQVVY